MKPFALLVLLGMMAIGIPVVAQNTGQETPNGHQTLIDGRWDATLIAEDKPVVTFDFKNENGVVTGVVIQDGKPTEIKNGALDGDKLVFETRHTGGGEPITMSWTGTVINDREGAAINLTCAMQSEDGGPVAGDLQTKQMQARRVK